MSKLIVGNWKMNGTIEETLKRLAELRHKLPEGAVDVVVAPPFTSLYTATVVLQDTQIKLAAQNMHWENEGPFTGEVSGAFVRDVGCSYVLIGHSERRQFFGETDERVNKKVQAALALELIPILCIGETQDQRRADKTEAVLEQQLKRGLQGILMSDLKPLVIAYEPVWAIGTGQSASTKDIEDALYFIRNWLAKAYDAPTANGIRLLYGGSVSPETARGTLQAKEVGGLLVGGASLAMDKFLKIVSSREETQ